MGDEVSTDWKRAHDELIRISRERCDLDWDEGRWLLVARRTGAHVRMGFGSFVEYAERLLGHDPRTTNEKCRVAEALEHLPQLEQALKEGLLSWSSVRELSRVATDRTEADWIAAARGKTVRDLERLVRGRKPGDGPTDPAKPEAKRHVLRLELSTETMATFREALVKLRRDAGGPLDDDAAMLLMARHVLAGPSDEGRASYQIAMTVCEQCRRGTQQGKGEQLPVAPEIVQMAECDATRFGPPGTRATQTIPPAVHRHVMRRDSGCCVVPGCRQAVFLDVHHCDPRAEGGTHDPERLITLCSAHHRAVHLGALVIDGTASTGFVFRHADGSEYGQIAAPERADVSARVFQALRRMGFNETQARRALEQARVHVGSTATLEDLLRAALARVPHRTLRCSDGGRPTYQRQTSHLVRPPARGRSQLRLHRPTHTRSDNDDPHPPQARSRPA